MAGITNIAGYKFVPLVELKLLRTRLTVLCKQQALKGTILISTEGINLFVAGARESVDMLLAELRALPGMAQFQVKISETDYQPFNRMLVRIKREIIAFGVPGINPAERTSPKLPAATLKQWLDEGRALTLLDTRNDYEVKLGTFKNAIPIRINHFRDFPAAVEKLSPQMKEQPVVMFCTGGIRCEKAGPFMEKVGFKNVFQLDGGILKYFEECGGAHYDGECFVFDQRVGVDPSLQETDSNQCFNCLSPLTSADQRDPRYVPGRSCPFCYRTPEEQRRALLLDRQDAINRVTSPLPGSVPYDNFRPLSVPGSCEGKTVGEFLAAILPHVAASEWASLSEAGLLVDSRKHPIQLSQIVRAGERYFLKLPSLIEPAVNPDIVLLHEDEALIVLNKPAPLPMHPGGRFNRNTLQHIILEAYQPERPRPAHRLDANTSGVTVFTRKRSFATRLQPQFARGEVQKEYLALVQGLPPAEEFESNAPISEAAGEVGSRVVDYEAGLPALTRFKVLATYANSTALLLARPFTGRTNQIRVHLWDLGFPIVGDPLYLPNRQLGQAQTLPLEAEPLCLHSWQISFRHPATGKPIAFSAPTPGWAKLNDPTLSAVTSSALFFWSRPVDTPIGR